MRLSAWVRTSVVAVGLYAGAAFAGREMNSFADEEQTEMTAEEQAEAARESGRPQVSRFGEEQETPPKPFPWMMVLLVVSTIVVSAPFAVRMYRRTSEEVAGANAFGFKAKAAAEDRE